MDESPLAAALLPIAVAKVLEAFATIPIAVAPPAVALAPAPTANAGSPPPPLFLPVALLR